ncbi:hypothetical protein EP47_12190 [Legionella norrlandica]|uniref:Coiled-coil-containing protein n=1 Tax=Legionella norrlandica TaxID=1498499 RepID=A0A0A2SVS9_9GAMM|nr:hypothetical protein [Legionella norrlandica]KGP63534.1 hypothetical protein EP47_12190 [Legionella norrlandica]
MSRNALFNLVKDKINKAKISGAIDFSELTHSKGTKYYKFELPLDKEITIGEYTLSHHHVSIFEKPYGWIDSISQYHYTAYFKNQLGTEYRLHVYFDSEDNFVNRPLFSRVTSENEYIPVDCEENEEVFKLLADRSTRDLVKYLRGEQQLVVEDLKKQFEVLESQLTGISESMRGKEEHLEILDRQIDIQKSLLLYSNFTPGIRKALKHLLSYKKALMAEIEWSSISELTLIPIEDKQEAEVEPVITRSVSAKREKPSSSKKPSFFAEASSSKSHTVQKKPAKKEEDLSVLINKFKLQVEQIKAIKLEDEQLIKQVVNLYAEFKNIDWKYEFGDYSASIEDIKNLKALRTKIEGIGVNLLQRLLAKGQYQLAEEIAPFFPLLSSNMVLYALQFNQAQLMALLLKYQTASIHFKDFAIKTVEYASIVDYCFKNSTPETNMLDILDLLVKNGESLMGIDKETGLPFAAILLMQPNHPLRPVLEKNFSLTINNIKFYKQLNQMLNVLPSDFPFDAKTKDEIQELIKENQRKIELLKQGITYDLVNYNQQLDVTQYFHGTAGEEFVKRLNTDPDVMYNKKEIEKEFDLLLPKLPRIERISTVKAIKMDLDKLRESLNAIEDFDVMPFFEDIKREVIKRQLLTLEMISLKSQLIEVQKEVPKVVFGRKLSKGQRRIAQEQEAIIARMSEIAAVLDSPYDFYDDSFYEDLIDSLSKMRESLKHIANSLGYSGNSLENENEEATEKMISGLMQTFFASGAGKPKEGEEDSNTDQCVLQ